MSLRPSSVHFENYKGLTDFRLNLRKLNILVGPNNAGKSTVIGAFRMFEQALRRARAFRAAKHLVDGRYVPAWVFSQEDFPVTLENVTTNYSTNAASITLTLEGRRHLRMVFPGDRLCYFTASVDDSLVATPKEFDEDFNFSIGTVPVLGPVEHEEDLVQHETVTRNLPTHRACRNFRSYWYHFRDDFEEFSRFVSDTWRGAQLQRPYATGNGAKLAMFVREPEAQRELFWSGFGFQIWCQLLTHFIRCRRMDLIAVDEPETYLHADVQRRLLHVVRSLGMTAIIATHSTEIISEAEPSSISLIDKSSKGSHRLASLDDVQGAYDALGSNASVVMTRLARNRHLLFVEGNDIRLIRLLGRVAGIRELADGIGFVDCPIGGFTGWRKVAACAWGFREVLPGALRVGCILDRDYFPTAELDTVRAELNKHSDFVWIHPVKEIENYFLDPRAIQLAVDDRIANSRERGQHVKLERFDVIALLEKLVTDLMPTAQSQIIGRAIAHNRGQRTGRDDATVIDETMKGIQAIGKDLGARMRVVSGKDLINHLNRHLQNEVGTNVSFADLASAMQSVGMERHTRDLLDSVHAFIKS
jgi:energy-coupling factor transporter ATP-binding protein EcfA2